MSARLSRAARALGARVAPEPPASFDTTFVHKRRVCTLVLEPRVLDLPDFVALAVARRDSHVFLLRGEDGALMPKALHLADSAPTHADRTVERGLNTRLRIAVERWRTARDLSLEELRERLAAVPFGRKLGSVFDKTRRLESLVRPLASEIGLADDVAQRAVRAARLCKCDAGLDLVLQYPELEGRVAERLLLDWGEDAEVARAAVTHRSPSDEAAAAPTDVLGALLSVADRLDTLTLAVAAGLIPTPNADVVNSRDQAQALLRTLIECGFSIDLSRLAELGAEQLSDSARWLRKKDVAIRVSGFLTHRLRVLLRQVFAEQEVDAALRRAPDAFQAFVSLESA